MQPGQKMSKQRLWELVKIIMIALAVAWFLDHLLDIVSVLKKL